MSRDLTKDNEIRRALHHKRLRRYREHADTIVVDELGLAHARSRIDVAVINGSIHGYEIKSALDTLDRFDGQLQVYQQTLQKLTFVLSPKHVEHVINRAPAWTGLMLASKGPRQGVEFKVLRKSGWNPEVDPIMMAHLLWRSEAVQLLLNLGFAERELRGPRLELYEILCAKVGVPELTKSIRECMVKRQVWRDLPRQA